jgi:rSAM/selenodomain-associated transferase 1
VTASGSDRVILFLKSFQAGQVKTRLAASLGDLFALKVYTAMVADLLAKLEPQRDNLIPYFDTPPGPGDHPASIASLLSQGLLQIQRGRGLGERMSNAFLEVFSTGVERAVLIGSDIPQIDSDLLVDYFEALRTFPMVLGPAADGGYYLIGFQRERFEQSIFTGIEWSTEQVFEQTLNKACSLELSCHVGAELRDIDTIEDLEALLTTGQPGGSLADVLEQYLLPAEA